MAVARRLSQLPSFVNPSLATGQADIVAKLALAAAATGADGIIVDAVTGDAAGNRQALPADQIASLIPRLKATRAAIQR